jgi:long-chain acyl-CoA synthetase
MRNLLFLFKKGINDSKCIAYKKNSEWKWISRSYLNNMINNSIQILKDNNIKEGDRVAYKAENSKEWIAWNFATMSLGAIWVPMYPQQNLEYCQHIIDDCQPKLLISDEKIETKNTKLINNKIDMLNYIDQDFNICHQDISTLVYTSGTTGKPKGVILTHDNIISNINAIKKLYPDLNNTTSLNILPWAHIYGLTCEMYYNLLNDNKMALASSKENFINECREIKPTVLFVVPKLLELIKNKLSIFDQPIVNALLPAILKYLFGGEIITLFSGGAKLDRVTRDFYLNNGISISEGYGCSETAPMISLNHYSNLEDRNIDSLGKLLDQIILKIFNQEICVAGPNVMQGYWNNHQASEDAFIFEDGIKYYKTGDSGYLKDNFLYLTGRISENYKLSNGKFVNVGELEEKIKKYIKTNFIIYGENMDYNILIVEKPFDLKLLGLINENIDSYLKIKKIIEVDVSTMSCFLTPKMSIKRKALINHLIKIEILK